nr:PREDICTED: uncharacterized protein LOC103314189 [Tribolium castaneum]|eukprot:XP_008197638.1 PREDICTED: uncharacterized protein LOC103314189 [Tribolium castaneum]
MLGGARLNVPFLKQRRTSSCPFPGAVFARIVFIPDLSNELRVILSGVIRKKKFEELHSVRNWKTRSLRELDNDAGPAYVAATLFEKSGPTCVKGAPLDTSCDGRISGGGTRLHKQ